MLKGFVSTENVHSRNAQEVVSLDVEGVRNI